jgi:NDP-sugar pyrophosphorylase family protein
MVGLGSRMKQLSELPKPLIEIAQRPMFFWAVTSALANNEIDELIFCYRREEESFFKNEITKYFPKATHQVFESLTNGQAETVRKTRIEPTSIFAVVDSDVYFETKKTAFDQLEGDWCILHWNYSSNPAHSFIEIKSDAVTRIIEKNPISQFGVVGFYVFSSKKLYDFHFDELMGRQEKYISDVVSSMIASKIKVLAYEVTKNLSFGTLEEFNRDYLKIGKIE